MGELADRIGELARVADVLDIYPQTRQYLLEVVPALANRVAELEQQLREAQLRYMRSRVDASAIEFDAEAPIVLPSDDVFGDVNRRLLDAEQRALAAEQRAAKAEGMLSAMFGELAHGRKCVLAFSPAGQVALAPGEEFRCSDNNVTMRISNVGTRPRILSAAVFELGSEFNPDLLERASVELAEEYIRVKAEQERKETA